MKILHIGFEVPSLARALRSASNEYQFLDWSSWTAMPNNTANLHRETLRVAEEFSPDITIMQIQAPGVYDYETVSKLPGFVVNWTWDVRKPTPQWILDLAPGVSLTGFTNEDDVSVLQDAGYNAAFIQSGFDDEIFRPDGSVDTGKYEEIVFIGNNYPKEDYPFPLGEFRIEMVKHLEAKYGPKFGVYGFGWTNQMKNFMYREHKEAECYRSCKMAINVSHYEIERYSSDRILRLMGSGAFCLAKWYPGIEKDFVDGKHLRTWKTLEELDSLIQYYTVNDDERIRIALAGCELVRKKYTWESMIDNIKKHANTYVH